MIECNVKKTKQFLSACVDAYLAKDAMGEYRIPPERQRPVYLEGPAGVGKTELVRQVAEEKGIGFVSYSMTHHSRQSAIGLPAIVEKEFGGRTYSATEYTMSEIVESVWDAKRGGAAEGILFADEINCVSETLSAAMLQFLQNKTFGPHAIPKGWIIVAAGNPPEYNKSVRRFDAVTLDRLRVIHVCPDREAWLEYAENRGIHPLVIQFVQDNPQHFYRFEGGKDQTIVTPRAWEDLGVTLRAWEAAGYPVDEALIASVIQDDAVAAAFAGYYRTVRSLASEAELTAILEGRAEEALRQRIARYDFQERWAVMICLYGKLQIAVENVLDAREKQERDHAQSRTNAAQAERERFQKEVERLDRELDRTAEKIDNVLRFLSDTSEEGREAELLAQMMLKNGQFLRLSEYRRLDGLIAVYDRMQERTERTLEEIRSCR